ncbi:MAG: bifunctional diaminohydroxyphosphoribosylaminopyrimidine deaminase/5-amino-6-(5-phosphoribosylamino)uracil reductase RibD [Bordetella sp.]|nr:MAG: bifunctional diaminohydroxyphosphoribosylaminopyrimidine deaminase/5-amino-6-(5-phosphoribosylamino)uracil reductase RibD [Bordetella sp.]
MISKFHNNDILWMEKALALAETVLYNTTPNPRVGCIIVKNGHFISQGVTQVPGEAHAEICAIQEARLKNHCLKGSTIYVTLEPCSHYGRTPPCVDSLLAIQPKRVVVAMVDPNPNVRRRGINRLRAAGIDVTVGVCKNQALQLNVGFVSRMTRGTPWIWLKIASSLDGRSSLYNGKSQWITGYQARKDGHHWRARSCVILTGIGTILKDNPLLNVRNVNTIRQPIKAIIDTQFRIPENARIFDGSKVLIFTSEILNLNKASRLAKNNVEIVILPIIKNGKLDLSVMIEWFASNNVNEIHVEAGSILNGALLLNNYIDELIVYISPILIGDACPIAKLPILEKLDKAWKFSFLDLKSFGNDIRFHVRSIEKWNALCKAIDCI